MTRIITYHTSVACIARTWNYYVAYVIVTSLLFLHHSDFVQKEISNNNFAHSIVIITQLFGLIFCCEKVTHYIYIVSC